MIPPPFRLASGDTGPVQQSSTTCGSACLTVARMLVDERFAEWVRTGAGPDVLGVEGDSPRARFAAYEQVVQHRTNEFRIGDGELNLPWPRALGTPPWGARAELELGASRRGTSYAVEFVRHDGRTGLARDFAHLTEVVAEGEPGLLYVGNVVLPRHIVLVLPGSRPGVVDVYDPGSGRVVTRRTTQFVRWRLALSGWDVPWFVVVPAGPRPARPVQSLLDWSLGWARRDPQPDLPGPC